jgi:hypothetical protein
LKHAYFAESVADLVESGVATAAESVAAGAVTAAESEGGVTVVVESPVASVLEEELLHAVKKAATVKTSNNFFIVFNFFKFLNKVCYLYPFLKKVTH